MSLRVPPASGHPSTSPCRPRGGDTAHQSSKCVFRAFQPQLGDPESGPGLGVSPELPPGVSPTL